MENLKFEMPWVIFQLDNKLFALSSNYVREMIAMPNVVHLHQTPEYIRGIINPRGHTFSVMDLRIRMGMKPLTEETEELVNLLGIYETAHKEWVTELEQSVREKREFKLTTNPHECAFGKWYDSYTTNNRILAASLSKMNQPHKKIHDIANVVKELVSKNEFDKAYELIDKVKETDLSEILFLFAEVRTLLLDFSREIALMIEYKGKELVVSVDSVNTVETLKESNIEEMTNVFKTVSHDLILGIGKRDKSNEFVQILNIEKLFS